MTLRHPLAFPDEEVVDALSGAAFIHANVAYCGSFTQGHLFQIY
jgi:hypothetical protein